MRTIGIRELKAKLSQVLRDVQGGDIVLVTDRGRVVAELRSPEPATWGVAPPYRALIRMAAVGHLRVAETVPDPYPPSPLSASAGMARELLDSDRADR